MAQIMKFYLTKDYKAINAIKEENMFIIFSRPILASDIKAIVNPSSATKNASENLVYCM